MRFYFFNRCATVVELSLYVYLISLIVLQPVHLFCRVFVESLHIIGVVLYSVSENTANNAFKKCSITLLFSNYCLVHHYSSPARTIYIFMYTVVTLSSYSICWYYSSYQRENKPDMNILFVGVILTNIVADRIDAVHHTMSGKCGISGE